MAAINRIAAILSNFRKTRIVSSYRIFFKKFRKKETANQTVELISEKNKK
jgi:hypothetical protein